MVTLNKIYTRTGDDGSTGLVGQERRLKCDLRIDAYGTVDETNAAIGMARVHTAGRIDELLFRFQNDLFDLGADLATPHSDKPQKHEPLRIIASQVQHVEAAIDEINENLSPLKSFVLPGGSPAAAALHLARTIARRAERLVVELSEFSGEEINPEALKYLNRLSDFLFVASRAVNDNGAKDVLWVPGANR